MIGIRTVALLAVGLGLMLVAVLDVGYPSPCEHARGLAVDGRLADARGEYLDILRDRPSSDCATKGLDTVTERQCAEAKLLAEAGRAEEAQKAYLAIATTEPVGRRAQCARAALTPGPESCAAADKQAERGLLTAAHAAYVSLLTKPRTERCADEGLHRVTIERCAAARRLAEAGFENAAEKAYSEIATTEPVGAGSECARATAARVTG